MEQKEPFFGNTHSWLKTKTGSIRNDWGGNTTQVLPKTSDNELKGAYLPLVGAIRPMRSHKEGGEKL
jgi:hypothetical protein